jgi:hypothetical protein
MYNVYYCACTDKVERKSHVRAHDTNFYKVNNFILLFL